MEREYTKENPGCYHSMISYLAKIENTTTTKKVELKDFPKSIKKGGKRYCGISVFKNGVEYQYIETKMIKGGVTVRICSNDTAFPIDAIFDKIIATENKTTEDFKTPINNAGKYNDSLGGGWNCKVPMYEINGQYFAMMECAH